MSDPTTPCEGGNLPRAAKSTKISVKRHAHTGGRLVAACDEQLLGREFKEGKLRLKVRPDFYDGERVDEETYREIIGLAEIVNIVGERTVQIAIDAGIIDEDSVIRVDGVPHAQFVKM